MGWITRWNAGSLALVGLLLLGAGALHASSDEIVVVAQPLWLAEEMRFTYSRATYVYPGEGEPAGWAIDYTCNRNAIIVGRGGPRDSGTVENWNEAHEWGLAIRVTRSGDQTFVPHPRGTVTNWSTETRPGFWIADTVVATLDVSGGERFARSDRTFLDPAGEREHLDRLVEATVHCIRLNAMSSRTPIRTLVLHIDGPPRYAKYAKTYTLWQPPPLPERKR